MRALSALLFAVAAVSLSAQTATTSTMAPSGSRTAREALGSRTAREALGPPRGVPLSGAALETQATQVASLLRCPVCQGLSIDDSPAPMARNMSLEVRDLLAAGYDQEQVLQYFERSYGEFVLLQPPLRGVNWLVWLAPGIALIIGGVAIVLTLRKMSRSSDGVKPASEEPQPDTADAGDPELEQYIVMVRELAGESSAEPRNDTSEATS